MLIRSSSHHCRDHQHLSPAQPVGFSPGAEQRPRSQLISHLLRVLPLPLWLISCSFIAGWMKTASLSSCDLHVHENPSESLQMLDLFRGDHGPSAAHLWCRTVQQECNHAFPSMSNPASKGSSCHRVLPWKLLKWTMTRVLIMNHRANNVPTPPIVLESL